jgi:tryptophan-rich sensory protein
MIARYSSLAAFLLVVVITAAISGSFEAGAWYVTLVKPEWTLPNWAFGPVWSAFYVLVAAAMWRVWITVHHSRNGSLIWWLLQVLLVLAWSWLFFGLNRIGWSMLELVLLVGVSLYCMKAFSRASGLAAGLMLPGLLWLIYLWYWNFTVWMANGGSFGLSFD